MATPSASSTGQQTTPIPAAAPESAAPTDPAYINSVGMSFVLAPAGSYLMGADESDTMAGDTERPQHEVALTRPFLISQFEVTQQQWRDVMGFDPYSTLDRSNPYYEIDGMAERLNGQTNPATVSWQDAQDFISRLNTLEETTRYRLPTEAEWEYAARAGTTTAYSFGDDSAELGRHAWYGEDFATGSTHPVGQKLPNPWGLYDVHGNVWEWTQDWYSTDYYASSPTTDPSGPESGTDRVVRGGSWHQTASSWTSSFRKGYAADYRGISIGFRLVAEPQS